MVFHKQVLAKSADTFEVAPPTQATQLLKIFRGKNQYKAYLSDHIQPGAAIMHGLSIFFAIRG